MNTAKLLSKRVVVTTTAAVAALAIGGGVWATSAQADVRGDERDRIGSAAVQAVGGGTVTDVETSDDAGEAYEAEIRRPDGTEVDVVLDKDLKVIAQHADTPDADDRALTEAERASAVKAALDAVGSGTVTGVEADDENGVAYEVEVRAADGAEWDVDLDAAFKVLTKTADN